LNRKLKYYYFILFFAITNLFFSQNVTLFEQFNGRVDFTFIGNTLNTIENNTIESEPPAPPCIILTSSSANLTLNSGDVLEKAYLYWAGSGTGDFNVKLNNVDIVPDRTFAIQNSADLPCFSAFKDITSLVQIFGNGNYTLSDFDLSNVIEPYCPRGGNFGGWAIVVVYKNNTLPINQLNVYDGLQRVPDVLNITLNSLNVIDNVGAKIGFVAWEGDKNIQVNETLRINNNILSNALNPANNAFNGTSTITGSDQLFNMDLDIYDIQNNISIGDSTAQIDLTSNQDFVMINVIVTKLNSQLPDATISFSNIQQACNSRQITVDYVVKNLNCTDVLPAGTPIAFYANNILVGTSITTANIPIDGSISSQITLNIPNSIPANFVLKFVVDDTGNGTGIRTEIIETNNVFSQNFSFYIVPLFNVLPDLKICKDVLENTNFDFSSYSNSVKVVATDIVQFFETYQNAFDNQNPILNIANFTVNQFVKTIYVRLQNANCFSITSFTLNIVLFPKFNFLPDLFVCKQSETSSFDFSSYINTVKVNASDTVKFFNNLADANANLAAISISSTGNFIPTTSPKVIFVRIDNGICFSTTSFKLTFYDLPKYNLLPNLESCDQGLTLGFFDFSNYLNTAKLNPIDKVSFHTTQNDAENSLFPLANISNYYANETPKKIFVRIENNNFCYDIISFLLTTKRCPIKIYNAVSANGDGKNDYFFIEGLRDIYLDFETEIYNRWGQLVWKGNNSIADFDGYSNFGVHIDNKLLPEGNYFYVLNLNDQNYPKPITGYLYLSK
jgi:gliding motility-associated-like protein